MFNQLDYNFSRKLDFQRNLNLFKEKNLSDLGLNNIYPSKRVSRYVDLEGHLFDKI